MLYRTFYEKLLDWKRQPRKKALLVSGARQTGKTSIIRKFGREQYASVAEINFIETPEAAAMFRGNLDADTIILGMTALLNTPLEPGRTLVFFDEIQVCPQARTAIKFLVEDGRFDYIESGSLLGVNSREALSYPVGFEEFERMYPMSFEEFAIANKVQPSVFSHLRDALARRLPVEETVHEAMKRLFSLYIIVGGMPAVVQEFVHSHDLGRVLAAQKSILEAFRLDITKYALQHKAKIRDIFDSIPSQLAEKNRRFSMASIRSSARFARYEDSFVWLRDAGVAHQCYNVASPELPLRLNEHRSVFKLFLADTGLLCASGLDNVQFSILNGDLSINQGGLLENVFAEIFAEKGFALHYFAKQKHGEVDFLLNYRGKCLPVEIKSGREYKRHAALDNILSVDEWGLDRAVVFCKGNIEQDGKILYLPWYLSAFMDPSPDLPQSISIDLSALTGTA